MFKNFLICFLILSEWKQKLKGSENVLINYRIEKLEISHNGTIPGCKYLCILTKLGHVIC